MRSWGLPTKLRLRPKRMIPGADVVMRRTRKSGVGSKDGSRPTVTALSKLAVLGDISSGVDCAALAGEGLLSRPGRRAPDMIRGIHVTTMLSEKHEAARKGGTD